MNETELLKRIERIESKLDRILELLEEELKPEEIDELDRISKRMRNDRVPLEDLL